MRLYRSVPGFSRYELSEDGDVRIKASKRSLRYCKDHKGYYHTSLVNDDGVRKMVPRHRLMLFTFKPLSPDQEGKDYVCKHINSIKGDDRLDNLEWVTQKENTIHAWENGNIPLTVPLVARNVETGEVILFASIQECAKALNLTPHNVQYRLRHKRGEDKVYPEGYQYRYLEDYRKEFKPWREPEDHDLADYGRKRSIVVYNVATKETTVFPTMTDAANFFNVRISVINNRLVKGKVGTIWPGGYLMKFGDDKRPFPKTLISYGSTRKLEVVDTKTNMTTIYESCRECATARGILPTTLNMRLNKNLPDKVWPDGCKYRYCSCPAEEESSV